MNEWQRNTINKLLGFDLMDTQFYLLTLKKINFFQDKIEYKIHVLLNIHISDIISIIESKNFKNNPLKFTEDKMDVVIIYTAPTPALYHIDRTLYRWNWAVYNLNSGMCIYRTNSIESPDITSTLFA